MAKYKIYIAIILIFVIGFIYIIYLNRLVARQSVKIKEYEATIEYITQQKEEDNRQLQMLQNKMNINYNIIQKRKSAVLDADIEKLKNLFVESYNVNTLD